MNAELLKRCKIKAQEELSDGRELILVDMHGFDIVQTSPRFAVFERSNGSFKLVAGSDNEDAAKAAFDTSKNAHKERSGKRH